MYGEFRDDELEIEFFRGSGPGGQHRNVTESGVRIRHLPTGIVVQACESRSQAANRRIALERLRIALARRAERRAPRIPTKQPARAKEQRLLTKRLVSATKRRRGPVREEE